MKKNLKVFKDKKCKVNAATFPNISESLSGKVGKFDNAIFIMEAPHVGLYVTLHAVFFPFNLNSDFFLPMKCNCA